MERTPSSPSALPVTTTAPKQAPKQGASPWLRRLLVLGVLAALVAASSIWLRAQRSFDSALSRRGRLAVVGPALPSPSKGSGTELVSAKEVPALEAGLSGPPDGAVASLLTAGGFSGIVLQPQAMVAEAGTAAGYLREYRATPGLIGAYLAPDLALYTMDHVARMPPRYGRALSEVARRMLAGERPPRLASFPPLLRRVQHVEVMVLLRSGPRPRLWRSARGSSIARAFLTAVRVARQRWREREQAMGEPLADALPSLTVDVSLLRDDGEIGSDDPHFIDRVVSKAHGVAYEYKGSWRYLLPDATADQGRGSASRALAGLFSDNGLPEDAYKRSDVKISRLRVEQLATSSPTRAPDALSPEASADAVVE